AVSPRTLETKFPGVYAVGDAANQGTPKAGVFAEGAARIVPASLIARLGRGDPPGPHRGQGSCLHRVRRRPGRTRRRGFPFWPETDRGLPCAFCCAARRKSPIWL